MVLGSLTCMKLIEIGNLIYLFYHLVIILGYLNSCAILTSDIKQKHLLTR